MMKIMRPRPMKLCPNTLDAKMINFLEYMEFTLLIQIFENIFYQARLLCTLYIYIEWKRIGERTRLSTEWLFMERRECFTSFNWTLCCWGFTTDVRRSKWRCHFCMLNDKYCFLPAKRHFFKFITQSILSYRFSVVIFTISSKYFPDRLFVFGRPKH